MVCESPLDESDLEFLPSHVEQRENTFSNGNENTEMWKQGGGPAARMRDYCHLSINVQKKLGIQLPP
jgi:hypothetical protein